MMMKNTFPLMTTQCCTHRLGVKCVQANACTFRFSNFPCMSGCTSDILHRPLLHQQSRPTWAKTSKRPKKPPRSSSRPSTWSSFTQMHHCSCPVSSQEERSGLPYRRVSTLLMQNRRPRPRHTGGCREQQNKLKPRTTKGHSNRVT